MHSRIRIIIS